MTLTFSSVYIIVMARLFPMRLIVAFPMRLILAVGVHDIFVRT